MEIFHFWKIDLEPSVQNLNVGNDKKYNVVRATFFR